MFSEEGDDLMVFSSKRDIWIAIPIWALIIVFLRMLYEMIAQASVFGIFVSIIIIGIIGSFWFFTRYKIENDLLIIYFGFIKKTINIKDIKSVRETTNPFVSLALSIRKIEINYDKYESVQISPKNINLLTDELQKRNSDIQVKNS